MGLECLGQVVLCGQLKQLSQSRTGLTEGSSSYIHIELASMRIRGKKKDVFPIAGGVRTRLNIQGMCLLPIITVYRLISLFFKK